MKGAVNVSEQKCTFEMMKQFTNSCIIYHFFSKNILKSQNTSL